MSSDPTSANNAVPTISARRGELLAAAALLAAGIFFAWQSSSMSFGDFGVPGPAFFPFALGIGLSLAALVIGAEILLAARTDERIELGHRNVVVVFLALIGVCLGFERLGAYLTLGALMVVLLVVLARVSIVVATLSAGATVVAVWALFKVALGVQLPPGPF